MDSILDEFDPVFDRMYATGGRTSVPPEALLKATVLMAMYSIRSELRHRRGVQPRLGGDLLARPSLAMQVANLPVGLLVNHGG